MGIVRTVQNAWSDLRECEGLPLLLGYAPCFAWNFLAFFSDTLVPESGSLSLERLSLVVPSSFANAFTLLLVLLLAGRIGPLCQKGRMTFLVSCLGGAGTIAVYASAWLAGAQADWVFYIGAVLTGCGSAWVLVSWGEVYSSLDDERSSAYMMAAFVIGFALYFLCMALTSALAALACALMLPASGLMARRAQERSAELLPVGKRDSAVRFAARTWKVFVALFVFGVTFWVCLQLNGTGAAGGASVVIGSMCLLLVVAAAVVGLRQRLHLRLVYQIVLPLMLFSFLATCIPDDGVAGWLAGILAMSSYTCLDCFVYMTMAQVSHATGYSPTRGFAVGRLVEGLVAPVALLVYELIGTPSAGMSSTGDASFLMFALAVSVALVLVAGLALSGPQEYTRTDEQGDGTPGKDGGASATQLSAALFARQCETAFERYGCTERERQVVLLITRGRSIPQVSQRLQVSSSTVKTHLRHVYEKMGVSDRQEMLDLIEGIQVE